MANEFKIKKGLIVTGADGGTVVDIQGSQGQLFSVTDDLSGSIFAVSDISGVPIFNVNSSGLSTFDGTVEIGTSTVATANVAADDLWLRSTGSNGITISSGNAQTGTIFFGDAENAAVAGFRYNHNTGDMAITAEDNITFACDNVGIGITSPTNPLTVDFAPYGIGSITASNNATAWNTNSAIMLRGASGSNGLGFGISGTANDRKSWIQSGHPSQQYANYLGTLAINPLGGAVGIGTTSPFDSRLEVAGRIRAAGGTSGGYFFGSEEFDGGFYAPSDGNLAFATNNAERIRIDGNGNLGIGVTNPILKLHIEGTNSLPATSGTAQNGAIRIENGVNNGVLDIGASNATGAPGWIQATDKADLSQAYKLLLNPNGGNVGIGATDPASKLNVASTGTNPYSATLDSASNMKGIRNVLTFNTDDMVGIYFATGTTTTGTHWSGITGSRSDNASHWGTQLNFYTHNNDVAQLNHATQKMVIKGDGNVGIGTTSPGAKLEVEGDATGDDTPQLIVASGGADNNAIIHFTDDAGSQVNAIGALEGNTLTFASQNELVFKTNTSSILGTTDTRMIIDTNGKVGIGTTTFPTTAIGERELLVQGAIVSKPPGVDDYYSYLKSNWADDGAFELGIQGADTNHKFITSSNYYHGTQLNFHTSDQKRMVIDTNGDVGIGTTLPKAKLDVNGHFCVDSKAHTITNAFTTCLTVNLTSHTGCYVTLTCFGDWPSHSSAAYRGEFFLQNGDNGYAEPGIILRQDDNTSDGTDQIVCQIVDPTGSGNPKNFEIQIRHTDTTSPDSWTGQLTYTVQGKFNSIT